MAVKSSVGILLLCSLTPAIASPMSIMPKSMPSFCLDVLGQRTQIGTPVDVWKCRAGLLGQQWFFDAGTYNIRSALNPKKCIDASGPALSLNDCDSNSTNQLFGWDAKTTAIYLSPDKGDIKPSGSMCMQIPAEVKPGDSIALAPCDATSKMQQWIAAVGPPPTPPKNETFTFSLPSAKGQPTYCLDVSSNNTDNGSPVGLSSCDAQGSKGQEWIFAQGSYRIASALNPNKCIDATTMANGTRLILWECNGFSQQQWGFKATEGKNTGTVYLTQAPSSSPECLATDSSNKAVVGACVQWQLTSVATQITLV